MSGLLVILKNKFQQCQEKHAKGHQVLEVIVLHKHHLHSTRECRQHHPATRLSVSCLIVTYVKRTYNERIVNSRLYVFSVLGRKFIYNARIVLHIFAADLRGNGLLI